MSAAPTVPGAVSVSALPPAVVDDGSVWLVFQSASPLGDVTTHVGPVGPGILTPAVIARAAARVQGMVTHANTQAAKALTADASLCSRCVRTVMRMALGSLPDANLVVAPEKPDDVPRYAAAWRAVGPQAQKVQRWLAELSAEAQQGYVLELADKTLHVTGAPNVGGAPIKAGQWSEYKLCACGDPSVGESKPVMVVAGAGAGMTHTGATHAGAAHHTGCAGPGKCPCASCAAPAAMR